jgi:predicted transcriptional regulator
MPTSQANFDNLLSHFKINKTNGKQIQAFCPAHQDKNASLSITLDGNKALIHCFAGCDIDDVLKSANLATGDLFLDDNKPTNIYQYRDASGNLAYEKLKYRKADGTKTFGQRQIKDGIIANNLKDVVRIPFNYPKVKEQLSNGGLILYVEGEKDAKTAGVLGFVGTTMGGASDWKPEYVNYFKKANLILFPDKDRAGLGITEKMITDLKSVVKNLKVIILPQGKDLTEWVEAGNSDLLTLINNAKPEYSEPQGIQEPTLTVITGGYKLEWQGLNLKVIIDHIINDTDSEIAIYENDIPIYISGFKLLSISHKTELSRALSKLKKIDWDKIINQITTKVLYEIRKGEEVIWLTNDYGKQAPEYLLKPLFIKNSPNIIYADQSSAKSLFMTMLDIILALPDYETKDGFRFSQILGLDGDKYHTVLFLDWENNPYITGWTKQCLLRGLDNMDEEGIPIAYLHCALPLYKMISHIQNKIQETKADVVIIDSLGASVGADLNATEPAFQFFTALRQLPVTPLIIAHTAKDINNRRKTVYGNAYYSNEARVTWEIIKQQEAGSHELSITLFNRKPAPFAGIHNPLGFKFTFDADKIYVEKTEPLQDKQNISDDNKPEPMDVVAEILETSEKHLTPKQIANTANLNESTVRSCVKRLKDNPQNNIKMFKDGYGYVGQKDELF